MLFATVERFLEVLYTDDREHRTEDFFLRDACCGRDIRDDGGLDIVAAFGILNACAAGDHRPSFLPISM